MFCAKIMILKRGASFQYLKVSMLSFKNIGGGLFCFVVVLVWFLGLLVWLAFLISMWRLCSYCVLVQHTLNYRKFCLLFHSRNVCSWCGQYISNRNIFLTCSLQMTAQMWATADSPKLSAVWILMFLRVRSRFQVRVWPLRLSDGWQRPGAVWILLRNRSVHVTSISDYDCRSFLSLDWIWEV